MADSAGLDILAIAAHPDDIEITCGGLLIKMIKMGRKVGVLDLTRGEMGTFGDENDREAEASKAAEIIGLSYRENLTLPDSGVQYNQENKYKIARILRETKTELVILPHWEQRHPDHLVCSRLGFDACFLAGLKKINIDGYPFRPRKIIYASYSRTTDFSFLVDISDEFEQKCQAIAAYKSQFDNPDNAKRIFQPGINIFDYLRTRAGYLGQLAGVNYAEAYVLKDRILIDDPQKMPVISI
ncbi:MAG: bacillithiol biosynthesis deacetylase BshB1 [Candidatus Zixiibacteriota bacterium]